MKATALAVLIVTLTTPAYLQATTAELSRLMVTFETGSETGAVMVSLFDGEAGSRAKRHRPL